MVDGVTHLMSAFQAFRQQGVWTDRRTDNIVDGGAPFYRCYETADGKWIALGAIEPHFYANLIACMGLVAEELPDQNDRNAWAAMRERFGAVFRTQTRDEWVERAAGRDACLAPVLSIDEAPNHPHMRTRRAHVAFDGVAHPAPAPRFSLTPGVMRRPAPPPGRDSREALSDWGLAPGAIEALEAIGALAQT